MLSILNRTSNDITLAGTLVQRGQTHLLDDRRLVGNTALVATLRNYRSEGRIAISRGGTLLTDENLVGLLTDVEGTYINSLDSVGVTPDSVWDALDTALDEDPTRATALASLLDVPSLTGVVPTSRTIAGVDLTGNISGSALRSALLAIDPGVPSSGLVVDWRASALVLADGAPVGSWAPSTGVGTLTASGGARPTYRAEGNPVGGPAVEFVAADSNALTLAGVAGLPTGDNPGTVIAIVSRLRPIGGGGLQHIFQYGQAAGLSARGLAVTNVDNIRSHLWSGGLTETRSPRGQDVRILGHAYDGTRESIFVDGVDYGSADVVLTTGTSGGIAIGSNLEAGEYGNFLLLRLLGYSRVLRASDWQQIKDHSRVAYGT